MLIHTEGKKDAVKIKAANLSLAETFALLVHRRRI
jgi:hypothetical protein